MEGGETQLALDADSRYAEVIVIQVGSNESGTRVTKPVTTLGVKTAMHSMRISSFRPTSAAGPCHRRQWAHGNA
eukprot:5908613-Amphidinium_carterae.2